MIYIKSVCVALLAAVITAVAWTIGTRVYLNVLLRRLMAATAQSGEVGGIGAVGVTDYTRLAVMVVFVLAFGVTFWRLRRAGTRF
jgi:NADH:ubiquinone oxidoreductase subunit 4 (subunit M)